MRRLLGVLLALIAVPVALAAGAVAILVGPDNTVGLVDQRVSTEAVVIRSAEILPPVTGPTISVSFDGDAEAFVGVAHPVHVDSYLDDVEHGELSPWRWRTDLATSSVAGELPAPAVAPEDLDWWRASAIGSSAAAQTEFEVTDEPATVVIASADLTAPASGQLTATARLDDVFGASLVVAGVFALLALLGIRLARGQGRGRGRRAKHGRRRRGERTTRTAEAGALSGRGALLALATTVTLAGCGQLPGLADSSAADAGVVAATTGQAEEFFADYAETATTADPLHDAASMAAVEAGPVLAATTVAYAADAVRGTTTAAGPAASAPSSIAAPQLTSYPLWYVATVDVPGDTPSVDRYVVSRENAAAPWLATQRVRLPADLAAPSADVANGQARLAPDELADRGQEVLDALVGFAESGEAPSDIDLTSAGGVSDLPTHGFAIAAETAEYGTEERSCTLSAPDSVHWLASGSGTVGLATVECTQAITLSAGYWMTTPAEGYWTIPGAVEIVASSVTQAVGVVVYVAGGGAASVYGGPLHPTALSHTPR